MTVVPVVPDLFTFSYIPSWYLQLDALAELALPEPWRFRNPFYSTKNPDTPILERYIHTIFRKHAIDFNSEYASGDTSRADQYIFLRNEYACFHTGLYTRRYKPIYASRVAFSSSALYLVTANTYYNCTNVMQRIKDLMSRVNSLIGYFNQGWVKSITNTGNGNISWSYFNGTGLSQMSTTM